MRGYLLDTHALLWALLEPAKLGPNAISVIRDPANPVCVSAVNYWEIALKFSLGKLELRGIAPGELPAAAEAMGLENLPLGTEVAAGFSQLPATGHKDPFDRMLIWQALVEDLTLVTRDGALGPYVEMGLRTLW